MRNLSIFGAEPHAFNKKMDYIIAPANNLSKLLGRSFDYNIYILRKLVGYDYNAKTIKGTSVLINVA